MTDKESLIMFKKYTEKVRHCLKDHFSGLGCLILILAIYIEHHASIFNEEWISCGYTTFYLTAHNIFWSDINISWKLSVIKFINCLRNFWIY